MDDPKRTSRGRVRRIWCGQTIWGNKEVKLTVRKAFQLGGKGEKQRKIISMHKQAKSPERMDSAEKTGMSYLWYYHACKLDSVGHSGPPALNLPRKWFKVCWQQGLTMSIVQFQLVYVIFLSLYTHWLWNRRPIKNKERVGSYILDDPRRYDPYLGCTDHSAVKRKLVGREISETLRQEKVRLRHCCYGLRITKWTGD